MKDFFISSNDKVQIKTESTTTLPAIIRLNQYESYTRNINSNSITFKNSNKGYMGSNYYDFAFIINHHNTETLSNLYNKIYNNNNREVVIRKSDILNNFLILEIPDYGAQAMSPFFTDFVPHIYIEKKKLWQKHFCMLKHYSKKIVYILIEKDNNLGLNFSLEKNVDGTITNKEIDIRICFKNNIEKSYNDLKTRDTSSPSIKLVLSSTDGLKFSGTVENMNNKYYDSNENYYNSIQSQFFNSGSFESQYYNLSTLNDSQAFKSALINLSNFMQIVKS